MRVTLTVGTFTRILPEESTIGGVCIPKDTQVFADIYGIGLNENYWRDPLEFIPERWESRKEIDPFSFIPFGTGPRMCVGRRIAEAQMQLITAHLCSSYKLHLVKEPDPKFEVLIKPEGLNLSFEKRV
ncbi:hypothetical protein LOD99_9077 [Oopsacas minuta]|uniref:Cytochrome P450 n=1 Tax=Oopsacas minuta TaxID=111878 RepID=A0AAV7JDU0_9METZ|nr:hypothetical protein LOD99_9077 [Oopsacas minuta]